MEHDLEEDIRGDTEILAKIRSADKRYAQNVYAALCNMRWQPLEVWPMLKDEYWSCTWRGAGGVVADLRNQGEDYMDYYCSGMGIGLGNGDPDGTLGYESEGTVTEEVENDFARIGWKSSPWPDEKV